MSVCVASETFTRFATMADQVRAGDVPCDVYAGQLHKALCTCGLTRREYRDLLDLLERDLHRVLSDGDLRNICRRMDHRTLGEFALTIHDNTHREQSLAQGWAGLCLKAGLAAGIGLEDNGVDNSGAVVFGRRTTSHEPDFVAQVSGSRMEIPDGRHKLEIKYCPTDRFLTFKVADLRSYDDQNAYALILVGRNRMLGANGDVDGDTFRVADLGVSWWGVLTPDAMRRMLRELPVERFGRQFMGNKPAVRIYCDDDPHYTDYMTRRNWA